VAEVGVEQEGGPEKRILTITPADGRAGRLVRDAGGGRALRDELFVKLMLSLDDGVAGGQAAQRVIQVQRAALYRDLHRVTARRQAANPKKSWADPAARQDGHAPGGRSALAGDGRGAAGRGAAPAAPQPEPRPRGRPKKR